MKQRLTIPIHGNIIFGYPPELPERKEVILNGLIHGNNKPQAQFSECVRSTWTKVKKRFTRTGVRASSKI